MTTYSSPPTTFEQLVAPFPAAVGAVAAALRTAALTRVPGAHEHLSGGHEVGTALCGFERPTNVAFGLQPTATHCKLYLHHVRLADVAGLQLEGSGKNARHAKVATAAEAARPGIAAAIERAGIGAGTT